MAMMIPECVECKKVVLHGILRGGNRWVCNACEPQDPEVNLRWYPDPGYFPSGRYIVTAVVYAMKPCENCGNLWGSKGIESLSVKEMEDHGMKGFHLSEIEHSPREIVESKRAGARNKALEHFRKPIKSCSKCADKSQGPPA